MGLHTRPNGSTDFTDDPTVDPATGAKIDAELNAITSIINALDNANIASSPKISSAKVDLTTGGYVPTDGSTDMTATLVQAFEGIFREMRADGNAKIYDYHGSDGALWGMSYNTYWNGSAWSGRDTTAICAVLKMESDGLHYYHAVSGSAGSTPSWTELLHVSLTGITGASIQDGAITAERMSDMVVGDAVLHNNTTEQNLMAGSYQKIKETLVGRSGAYRIKFEAYGASDGNSRARIYQNGVAVGSERALTGGYVTYSEDISGWSVGDLAQIYIYDSGGDSYVYVKNFQLCIDSLASASQFNSVS